MSTRKYCNANGPAIAPAGLGLVYSGSLAHIARVHVMANGGNCRRLLCVMIAVMIATWHVRYANCQVVGQIDEML